MNTIDLAGRVAVITGAGSGLGLGIALRLVDSGAAVSLWDRDVNALAGVEKAMIARGARHQTCCLDVTSYATVEAAAELVVRDLGKIDILVNSAGISGGNAPTWTYPLEEWEAVVRINLTGTFHCCRAVVPHMLKRDYGRIVNIASIAGKEGNPNASAYSASKAGIIAITKSLGKELATTGIRVNSVAPAAVQTPLFQQIAQSHIDFMLSKIPMGRVGTIEEVAAMVAWMCSEECSFSTGAVFDLSGGRATY
jgi:3-oxoacyl-[acyl-carrier protein] reductase